MFETTSEIYNKIKKQYKDYVALYRFVNGGSIEGVTPFSEFYWRITYRMRYLDPSDVSSDSV